MIQQINQTDGLKKYITHEIEDAGLAVAVDSKLNLDEYIGIKVDDYYMGLHLRGETPKAVDFIVTVDCQCDAYCLYILELKNVKSPKGYTTKDIIEKFETAIDRFIKEDFKEIFLNDKYKYNQNKAHEDVIYDFQNILPRNLNKRKPYVKTVYVSPVDHAKSSLNLNGILSDPELYGEMLSILQTFDANIISINALKNESNPFQTEYMVLTRNHAKALPLTAYD